MRRIDSIQKYVSAIFTEIADSEERLIAYNHTCGVEHACALIAAKRGLDTELASVCGLLHDIYSFKTGVRTFHAINGAEMVRVAFKYDLKGLYTEDEQLLIRSAIFHHSDKSHIHDAYDELLKDADVFQHWLYDTTSQNPKYLINRTLKLQKEFGLPLSVLPDRQGKEYDSTCFSRSRFADIAERFAINKLRGERTDSDYMDLIRYFPEESAFDELKNAWCAAFVYHCASSAGLALPIRYEPLVNTRFACVHAWLEWGEKNGFCHPETDDVTPERGDIVIYDNVIPPENKPENSPWYDHIGVLLSVEGDKLTVAEGNAGNLNEAGIVPRRRSENIGRYLRIPEDYAYDGWKYDYKTGALRMESYI